MQPFKQEFHSPSAELLTERLCIRIDTEASYIERFRTGTDAELMAWCGFSTPEELELQRAKIAGGFSNYRTSTVFFHLAERATGRVIGSAAFHSWYPVHRRSELGYAITDVSRKGMGFMKEALPAVLDFGFSAMGLNRVEAFVSPSNVPSLRLVEGLGFVREGELREHYAHSEILDNSVVYGLLRNEWQAQ